MQTPAVSSRRARSDVPERCMPTTMIGGVTLAFSKQSFDSMADRCMLHVSYQVQAAPVNAAVEMGRIGNMLRCVQGSRSISHLTDTDGTQPRTFEPRRRRTCRPREEHDHR